MREAAVRRPDVLVASRRLLDALGSEGLGDEYDVRDFRIGGVEPRWALLPETVEACADALRICHEEGLAVVPAGLGARLSWGRPPVRADAVLSLRRLDAIVEHAEADLTLTVQAGATLASVNEKLAEAGQSLPLDPPLPERTTIGGLVAANVSGPLRTRFGSVRDSLLGLRAVLANGTLVKSGGRVVKNVAGYDLHKLLVGSFGTLAVIVEASFKLQPKPRAVEILVVRSPLVGRLCGIASVLARSGMEPLLLEVFVGFDEAPALAIGLSGERSDLDLAWERLATIAKDVESPERVRPDEIARRVAAVAAGDGTSSVVLRAGVPPRALRVWLERALGRLRDANVPVRAHAHAAIGVARLRLENASASLVEDLRTDASRQGGYLVLESASAEAAARIDPWGEPPRTIRLMEGIKQAFDPSGVLSPGRFVGGI